MTLSRSKSAEKLNQFPGIAFDDQAAMGQRGQWSQFFRRRIGERFDGRIIVEVGCFDAAYLCRIATKFPGTAFVGLDWKCKAIVDGAVRVVDQNLNNVALVRARGQDLLKIFGEAAIDHVWIFHPDPFAGAHELKNRLIAGPFLQDAHVALRDQRSTLTLKTDHPGYFQWVLGLFNLPEPSAFRSNPRLRTADLMTLQTIPQPSPAAIQSFRIEAISVDFWNDPAIQATCANAPFSNQATLFEQRFIKKHLPIYYLQLARQSPD